MLLDLNRTPSGGDTVLAYRVLRPGWPQPGKSGTKKVGEISFPDILEFSDRFAQDFPGK